MTMVEIAKWNNVSERTIYRYKTIFSWQERSLPVTIIIRGKRKCVNPLAAAAETPNEQCIGMSKRIFRYIARLRYPESGIPHTLRAKSIHQVLPMLSECASKNSFYICIVIPARKDSSPGTRSRSPPWLSMIFRTEESPIP